jgi:phosphoribosyl 1,2-cyclic phosphodiesterase
VRLLFCGVRGSTPAPGAEFVRVGGHTSCVALAHDAQSWTLLLDAGTGIRRVTAELGGRAFDGTVVLTHLHWDHLQGIPFFAAGDRDDAHVRVFIPEQVAGDGSVRDPSRVLGLAMSPPHFPIGPEGLRGRWEFASMRAGAHSVEGFSVTAFDVPHKGGRTFGLRVSDGVASIAYIPDHLPGPLTNAAIARECAGVDVLIHDAQFLEAERAVADLFGHATADDALALAELAGARRLALFHHAPARSDDDVEAIGGALVEPASARGVDVFVARESDVIQLTASRR